jgi:protein SCO1/2
MALVVGVAVLAGALALWWALRTPDRQATAAVPAPSIEQDLAALGRGIDDVAITTAGEAVRWGELNGRPRAVFFGFSNCPMICPVTIWELTHAMSVIGAPPESMTFDFVSVDPARDTPERLRAYLTSFDGPTRGLHAEGEALARIARSFEVTYRRQPLENGGYTIDHTATVFLLDRQGAVVDVIAYGSPPDVIERRLRALLGLPQPPAPPG